MLNKYFQSKPSLIVYYSHINAFKNTPKELPNSASIELNTHNIVIKNTGRESAHNVRIGHNLLPSFDISPKVPYKIENIPNSDKEVIIPILAPKEEIQISYLYFPPTTFNFRKQIDGLVVIVADQLQQDPTSGQLFIFRNRSGNKVKLLWWNRNGFWLFYKRIERGRFCFPTS